MRGADLAKAMASVVDRIVSMHEGAGALDRAVEAVVGTIGQFSGKDATSYLEAYRAEMVMRDIPEDRRLSGFPRVATPSIHAEVLEVREECGTWEEFEGRLLEKYGYDDALRLSKREFMERVETPGKGRSTSALLRDFEEQYARMSTLDRTVLDTSRVLLFVKSVDARDREKIGLLLEIDDGLTADWAVVKRVCGRFDKWRTWAEVDSVGAGAATTKKVEPAPPARKEEARCWPDGGSMSAGSGKGPSEDSALKMLELNVGKGGMKRLMEEAAARHVETVHYSASAGIRVGGEETRKSNDSGFWPSVLDNLAGVRLRKEEADRAEKRVQELTGWNDPVEEKTGFVEAACQNYEVLLEEKRAGRSGGADPSQRYGTRVWEKQKEVGTSGGPEKSRKPSF
jgi:hypothetical protein